MISTFVSPVVFSIDNNPQYTADIVLASLMDNQGEEPTQQETNISATIEGTSVHHTLNHNDDSHYIPDEVSQNPVSLKDLERTCIAGTNEIDLTCHQNEPHQLSYATTSHVMDSLLLDNEKEILVEDKDKPTFKPLVNISNNSQYKGNVIN